MRRTKKQERETVEAYKDLINYFIGSMTRQEMYEMLRYSMQFGEAESRVIVSSLVLAGAQFKEV